MRTVPEETWGKDHSGDNISTAGVFHPGTADPPVWKGNTDSGLSGCRFPGRNKGIKVQLMEDKNCELLFEYLRSILYDKEIQTLDITKLDEPYQKLGRRLQVLERTVEEMLEYSKDLSVGNWKKYRKV